MKKKNIITLLFLLMLTSLVKAQSGTDITKLRKEANDGIVKSQVELANRLLAGKGVAADFKEAAHWYMQAANKGNLEAQFNLAFC